MTEKIATDKDLQVDPAKVRAILEMPAVSQVEGRKKEISELVVDIFLFVVVDNWNKKTLDR